MMGADKGGGLYEALSDDDGRRESIQSIVLEAISKRARQEQPDEEATLYGDIKGDDEDDGKIRKGPLKIVSKSTVVKFLGVTVALLLIVVSLASYGRHSRVTYGVGRSLTFDEQRSGQYTPKRVGIEWISPVAGESGKGDFLIESDTDYRVSSWQDRHNETLVTYRAFVSSDGQHLYIQDLWLNSDRSKAIVVTNRKKNWRHSYFGQFWVLDIASGEATPVDSSDPHRLLSLAEWSPRGDRIAFVAENNLFLRYVGGSEDGKVVQVTKDGGEGIFYGRPDWVYEEEVFAGAKAMWWSQTGEYLAFLRTNDTAVPNFPIPYFVQEPTGMAPDAYPELRTIKYPKPGFENPVVEILFLEVSSETFYPVPVEEHPALDNLITEVVWTDSSLALVRLTNRESDKLMISVVDAQSRSGKIVRTVDAGADGGWFEVTQDTTFVPAGNGREQAGYIDTVVVDGFNHLAYFSPVDAPEPKVVLTRGEWEVDSAPSAVDLDRNIVYFVSTKESPVDRHLYAVSLDGTNLRNISDVSKDGYFGASFSLDARYVLLSYRGPSVPWQGVVDLASEDPLSTMEIIEDNKGLQELLGHYDLPSVSYSQIKVADDDETGKPIMANTVEIRPPHFSPSRKYPVVFFVYGGPISQTVTKQFGYDFQKVFSATADAVVVTVDGRGTGFMGRKFRAVVRDQLGHYEVRDQIAGATEWASRSYIDPTRIAIWGWSYGGYMTLKTLETDGGKTFSYGVAVAPVTDWRFYDSIYTERYMHTPQHNLDGYLNSAVTNATSLGHNKRFLVMHGTGDDNVHFQHTLTLLDKLDIAGVENYDVHVFPDSDHGIYYHNANSVVYDKISHWLQDAFDGQFEHKH